MPAPSRYIPNYIDVISAVYPTLSVFASGDPYEYENIMARSPDVVPSKATLDAHQTALTIDNVWTAIKAERDRRSQTGGYKVGANWFHSDQASRMQQIALVMLGANLPANLMWKTMSGSFALMTPTLAQQVFGTAVMSDQVIFGKAEWHRAQMAASPTPWSYDFSGGWPQTYEESLL